MAFQRMIAAGWRSTPTICFREALYAASPGMIDGLSGKPADEIVAVGTISVDVNIREQSWHRHWIDIPPQGHKAPPARGLPKVKQTPCFRRERGEYCLHSRAHKLSFLCHRSDCNARLSRTDESGHIDTMSNRITAQATKEALEGAWRELRGGEFLNAYDLARQALPADPENILLAHVACLALARSGATAQADRMYRESALRDWNSEDGISLRARIAKDMALASEDPARSPDLQRSVDAYRQGYGINGGYYPAINVAFLHLLAGDRNASAHWARTALDDTGSEESYYAEATRAEALLLLGQPDRARAAIGNAADLSADNPGERSTTWKQLRHICGLLGQSTGILAPLKPGPVVHFSGHIIAAPGVHGRFPAEQEDTVKRHLDVFFAANGCSRAFGSLAAGADILAAEAALKLAST